MVLWQDTKAICCASTNSNPSTSKDINRKLKDGTPLTIHCPECIVSYNTYIGGVDHNDQLRGYYNIPIKSRKYYKYLIFVAVDVIVTNMFVTSKFFPENPRKNVKDFRIDLAMEMIGDYNSRKKRGRPSTQSASKKFCESHFPTKSERKGNRCFFVTTTCNREEKPSGTVKIVTNTCATQEKTMTVFTCITQYRPNVQGNSDLWRDPPH